MLLDVRGRQGYSKGHVAGAINIPLLTITEDRMKEFSPETVFVVLLRRTALRRGEQSCDPTFSTWSSGERDDGGAAGWADEVWSKDDRVSGAHFQIRVAQPEDGPAILAMLSALASFEGAAQAPRLDAEHWQGTSLVQPQSFGVPCDRLRRGPWLSCLRSNRTGERWEQTLIAGRFQVVGEADSGIGLVSHAHDPLRWYCFVRQLEGL